MAHIDYRVRFPMEMHAQLTAIAAEKGCSLHSEILERLAYSLRPEWEEYVTAIKAEEQKQHELLERLKADPSLMAHVEKLLRKKP